MNITLSHLEKDSATLERDPPRVEEGYDSERLVGNAGEALVTVITVNYNGRHHLERCLSSLLVTNNIKIEVIVVDNGSTDGSIEWLHDRHPEVRVLPLGSNRGFGEANRLAVEGAQSTYIAFLNNDTEVEPDWLRTLLEALESDEGIAAACSTLRMLDHPEVLNARGGGMSKLGYGFDHEFLFPFQEDRERLRDVLFPTAAAMLMRKRDWESCGGFDRAFFMYHEDVDLGWRLWLLGKRVVVCADSIVYHLFGGTTESVRGPGWRADLGMRHNVRALIKNYELKNLMIALKGVVGRWVRYRDFSQAIKVMSWNLVHLPGTLKQRRWIQKRRIRSDKELFDRGLIGQFKFPPPSPELPRADPDQAAEGWIPSPVLLPGEHSSLGRLGYGWYGRERHSDNWIRWTCGHARCFLRTSPCARGRLLVTAHLPSVADVNRTLVVKCNGKETSHYLQSSGWETISLPVTSNPEGLLDVHLISPAWIPHRTLFSNFDFRKLGCRVKEIRFDKEPARNEAIHQTASVIIPTFNRWDTLEQTLSALERQTWRNFEVLIVDDGSTDGTSERLGQWRSQHEDNIDLKSFRQPNLKPGQARNHGLRYATGDIVIFIGDDTIPDPDFVESHMTKHKRMGEACAVLGFTDWHREKMRVTPFLEFINTDGPQFGYGHFQDGDDVPFSCFYTSNISVPRTILGKEAFHPAFDFVNWEDVELGYRLSLRGLRIVYDFGAKTRHLHPMDMVAFFKRQRQIGEKMRVILDLHPELERSDSMPPVIPAKGVYLASRVARWLLPLLNFLDARRITLPVRVYRAVSYSGLFEGIKRSRVFEQRQ